MMRCRQAGFTLVEIMVALLILGLALTAAFRALAASTSALAGLQLRQAGDWVAANRLAELRIDAAWPEPGTAQGTATQGAHRFRWQQTVRPTPNPQFRRVDLGVYAEGDDEHAIARLSGFVARPPQ